MTVRKNIEERIVDESMKLEGKAAVKNDSFLAYLSIETVFTVQRTSNL